MRNCANCAHDPSINVFFNGVFIPYFCMRRHRQETPQCFLMTYSSLILVCESCLAQQLKISHKYTTIKCWLGTKLHQVLLLHLSFSFNALGIYSNTQKLSPEVLCKKGVLKHFAKFIEKLLFQSLFFHKVGGWLEKRLQRRCFSMNLVRFFRMPILYNMWTAASGISENSLSSIFCTIVCKSVFELLRVSFQLILQWCSSNQCTNVDNAMQEIIK